jgi:8-amino-7-oxononanoate synthase
VTRDDISQLIELALGQRREQRLLRERAVVLPLDATHVQIGDARYISFCGNNYLGLSHHPALAKAIARAVAEYGFGAGASALVSGNTPAHRSAETALAAWKGTEACVLLPSGYQANHAAVQMLAALPTHSPASLPRDASISGVRFLIDKLAHASLIDAVRGVADEADESGTRASFRVFPHNHMVKLRRLLAESDSSALNVVVTESIFSMDGDAVDLAGIAEIKRDHPFFLLLDEAHGSGVYGQAGAGYAAEMGLSSVVDLTVVTLSKALGGVGGAICASRAICDAVVNFGRAYVYSTAIPPAVAAAAEAAVGVMRDEPQRQARVREFARRVRSQLAAAGLSVPSGDSPIIPVILGDEAAAMHSSARLREHGILAIAIRPPTVPRGTSRLRITLSSEHTDQEVDQLVGVLSKMALPANCGKSAAESGAE